MKFDHLNDLLFALHFDVNALLDVMAYEDVTALRKRVQQHESDIANAVWHLETLKKELSDLKRHYNINLNWLSSDTWRDAQNMLTAFPGGEVYFNVVTPHGESIGLVLANAYTKRHEVQDQAVKLWLEEKGFPLPQDARILYKEIAG